MLLILRTRRPWRDGSLFCKISVQPSVTNTAHCALSAVCRRCLSGHEKVHDRGPTRACLALRQELWGWPQIGPWWLNLAHLSAVFPTNLQTDVVRKFVRWARWSRRCAGPSCAWLRAVMMAVTGSQTHALNPRRNSHGRLLLLVRAKRLPPAIREIVRGPRVCYLEN